MEHNFDHNFQDVLSKHAENIKFLSNQISKIDSSLRIIIDKIEHLETSVNKERKKFASSSPKNTINFSSKHCGREKFCKHCGEVLQNICLKCFDIQKHSAEPINTQKPCHSTAGRKEVKGEPVSEPKQVSSNKVVLRKRSCNSYSKTRRCSLDVSTSSFCSCEDEGRMLKRRPAAIYIPCEKSAKASPERHQRITGLVSSRNSYRINIESVIANICSESNFTAQLLKDLKVSEDHFLFWQKSSVVKQLENAKSSIDLLLRELIVEVDRQSQDSFPLEESVGVQPNLDLTGKNACTINCSGVVNIAGCEVKFPQDTFSSTVTVKLSCTFPIQDLRPKRFIVTSELTCLIEGDVKPSIPFNIAMPTCYCMLKAGQVEQLKVEYSTADEDCWQTLEKTPFRKNMQVEFETEKLGKYRCVAVIDEFKNICKHMKLVVFLKPNVEESQHEILCCLMDDLPQLETEMWCEMSPLTVYERIMPLQFFTLAFDHGLDFLLSGPTGPALSSTCIDKNDGLWRAGFHTKIPFTCSTDSPMKLTILTENKVLLQISDL